MKFRPTPINIVIFCILFQLYPLGSNLLVRVVNPEPKTWAVATIYLIAEFAMIFFIVSWRRRAEIEVIDEREIVIQLRVRSLMLAVSWLVMCIAFLVQVGFIHELPLWIVVALTILSGLVAEVWGNRIYRRL